MKIDLKGIIKPICDWLEIFNHLCKPALKHTNCHIEQEIDHERNKLIVKFYLAVIILLFTQILIKKCTILVGAALIGVCAFKIILLMISCHYNVNYFKICFSIVISFCGPLLMNLNAEGGQRAWLASQMYPPLILFCTGSLHHFAFQAGLQVFLQNFVYPQKMLPYLEMLSSEEYLRMWTKNSTSIMLIQVAITVCLDSILKKAYSKMQIAEKKKEELERQRIFVLGFSHELRNLINSLMGNVKLASLEVNLKMATKFLQNAEVCGELLLHLINNILDTGKVEVGDLEINPVPTDVHKTVTKIWGICSELIKGKNLFGKLQLRHNLPQFLNVDPYRLTQIFMNLIGNAVKFTEKGTISITIEWLDDFEKVVPASFEPLPYNDDDEMNEGIFEKNEALTRFRKSFIVLSSSQKLMSETCITPRNENAKKGLLKVTINDTGLGMTKESLSKLFQKFTQVSADSAKRKLGTGLGLFITKELCERMNGQIKVFSKEGKGSCFIFCIPLTPVHHLSMIRGPSSQHIVEKDMKSLKTMIADDDSFSQLILKNYFHKLQIQLTEVAENGLEAYHTYVAHAQKGDPLRLVTMDLTMPVMGGKEASEKIRKYEEENGMEPCTLIIISGNCSESEIAECTDMNGKVRANAFLKKPASLDEILQVVRGLC